MEKRRKKAKICMFMESKRIVRIIKERYEKEK